MSKTDMDRKHVTCPDRAQAVDTLLRAAFETGDEAELVHRLRRDGDMAHEALVCTRGILRGYAALSHMQAPSGWLCLAPVATDPAFQRRGIGSGAVRLALDWAADRGAHVVVLGDPGFYGARGFSSARAAGLTSPYPVSHTLLAGPGAGAPVATLLYAAAFSDMG